MSGSPAPGRAGSAALAARLRRGLGWEGPAPPGHRRALIVLSGLPGTGKSYLAAAIGGRHPAAVVRTDEVRKALFPHPTYSGEESGVVYLTCYALLGALLADGYTVIFDGTNMARDGRRRLRDIAAGAGAPSLTLITVAPPEVVAERLRQRSAGQLEPFSSDADWPVYEKMARSGEPAAGDGEVLVDTSRDLGAVLAAVDAFLAAPEPLERAAGEAGASAP